MQEYTNYQLVRQFTQAMGQPIGEKFDLMGPLAELRDKLLLEEVDEVMEATDAEGILKELCDVLYVAYGYAASFGWDIDEAFRRVHLSNMSKLGPDGKPVRREDGKIMKGPNYQPPKLTDLVA